MSDRKPSAVKAPVAPVNAIAPVGHRELALHPTEDGTARKGAENAS